MKKLITLLALVATCSTYAQTENDPKERGICVKELRDGPSHHFHEVERWKDVTRERCDKEQREAVHDYDNNGRTRFEPREPRKD